MTENEDAVELLFFDTFSHEVDTDINLDLVQFPKPVYITQVRIIPLGARVQADFPGGVRLGATNPSKFDIEFFVNDLGMPGASTFENLGHLQYNQNDCIHLECAQEKIPTDGLVLRGWYSTITLAVYGILTNAMNNEPIASPPLPPPCEPTSSEELCASSDQRRSSTLQDEHLKSDWKEPLAGEVQHAHKTSISDYEREELDYGHSRDHYHHSGDERERRLRKTSHSSDRSASSRNRTHSENERDYMRNSSTTKNYLVHNSATHAYDSARERDKSARDTRDWSRSPEYARRSRRKRSERSRSDAEELHKWPRTPPATSGIDSPSRPRSPDHVLDYMDNEDDEDDESSFKLKSRNYVRSSDSLLENNGTDNAVSAVEDELTPGTPGEQYEPILSDDELIGDDDSLAGGEQLTVVPDEFELELEAAAAAAEPAIIEFDAYKMPLQRYESDLARQCSKELEQLQQILQKHEKCAYSLTSFIDDSRTSVEERENFVFFGEQLINHLTTLSLHYKRRNFVLQNLFQQQQARWLQLISRVLQIALDTEAACLQSQPAFKIRHIKVGARLAELLGSSAELLQHCLSLSFDPCVALFALYQQSYMALSIKLMLLRGIYALLDSKLGVNHFLHGKLNGYQLVLEALQQARLTPVKYALQAIIKKLHLHEALQNIHEQCNKIVEAPQAQQLIEQAMTQLIDALTTSALSYQQPKRFLPVSRKFEIIADVAAQRSFGHTLQAYMAQHALGECLLLLFSQASALTPMLLQRALQLLRALLQTYVGVDYLVDDCFESTQLLVAVLLGNYELPEQEQLPNEIKQQSADDLIKTAEKLAAELKTEDMISAVTNSSAIEDKTVAVASATSVPNSVVEDEVKESATPLVEEMESVTLTLQCQMPQRLREHGIELAYKVQTRYQLDAIVHFANFTQEQYVDANELAAHLHALYSHTCCANGRRHTIELLSLNNNMQLFLELIRREQCMQAQRQLGTVGAKYKSPVLSYAVDMLDCCVRYSEKLDYLIEHGARILELAKNHDNFEPSVSAVLQEMYVYLKPLEVVNIFAYEDITPLVDLIKGALDYINTFPGELIMGLRILRHLAIGEHSGVATLKNSDTKELKHQYVALQFYAADGVQILLQILEKLCSYFEQPGLHAPALVSTQGLHCCQIILPTLQILRALLTDAIRCRDVEFKDLTAIEPLMRTYQLLYYYPARSQAVVEVTAAKQQIIQLLLAYTQPHEVHDEESLHKSLWTQMLRELLNHIDQPANLLPGLQLLAELLPIPLPLPLPSTLQLTEKQAQRLIVQRKLWSAHLHPQSTQIAELIEIIAPASFPQLSDLLIRVCLQLADLAPNMSLLISKTVTELLFNEWQQAGALPSAHLARLLHFFSRLTAYPALKSSALSILSGKLWELFQTLLALSDPNPLGYKCQAYVHRLLESFLDSEISLISPQSAASPQLNLASLLPPKELIPRIADAIVSNLIAVDVTHEVSALGVRNVVILTEHDITFYYLSLTLKQKSQEFHQWIEKITRFNETESYNSNIESLVLLLRSLTYIEEHTNQDTTLPPRTLLLSAGELAHILGGQPEVGLEVLQRMHRIFEQHKAESNGLLLQDVRKLCEQLQGLTAATVTSPVVTDADDELPTVEPALPQTESLVMQYAARPIFTLYDAQTDDLQLSARYWLEPLPIDELFAEDYEAQYERITCDLTELAAVCLPAADTNLGSDCKRVLHLSASPQSNRERTPTAPCFRTRRVEVEPSTGRPEKKLYITPVRGRGFSRAPPARGDLFRSRPPNTSRPPSLHVDDFLALETRGAQPTGPTGYNKIPALMRGSRVGRNRGSRISAAAAYRKSKVLRTSSPSAWNESVSPHYRTATAEPHFGGEPHYAPTTAHFGRPRGRGLRARSYLR